MFASSSYGAVSEHDAPFQFQKQAHEYADAHARPNVVNGSEFSAPAPNPRGDGYLLERMDHFENVLGKMAGVYQATMERFAHLAENNFREPRQGPPPAAQVPVQPVPVPAAPEKSTPVAAAPAPPAMVKPDEQADWGGCGCESDEEGSEWRDYHGGQGQTEEKSFLPRCLPKTR